VRESSPEEIEKKVELVHSIDHTNLRIKPLSLPFLDIILYLIRGSNYLGFIFFL
jgi:hypothetical protein